MGIISQDFCAPLILKPDRLNLSGTMPCLNGPVPLSEHGSKFCQKKGPDTFSYQTSVDPNIFQTEEFPNYISKDHIAPTVSLKYSDTFVAAFDSAASPLQSDTINNIIDAGDTAISNPSTNPNGETISQDLQTPLPHKEGSASDDNVTLRSEGSVATSFTEIETDLVADKMTTWTSSTDARRSSRENLICLDGIGAFNPFDIQ